MSVLWSMKRFFLFFAIASVLTACETTPTQQIPSNNKQNIIQPEIVNLPKKPLVLSSQQYEQALNNNAVTFTAAPNQPSIMPVKALALQLTASFGRPELEVYAASGLNFGLGAYARIQINEVLASTGQNICRCDAEENVAFTTVFNKFMPLQDNPIVDKRDIYLVKGAKATHIKSLAGVVRFYLPVNVKPVTLSSADVGKTMTLAPNLNIVLKRFGKDRESDRIGVNIEVQGKEQNLLLKNFYAYDEKGELLEPYTASSVKKGKGKFLGWSLNKVPSKIELFVAEKLMEKEVPFAINR